MSENDIGIQELVYQVKRELLAPNPAQRAKDPDPLFRIDKIDLEIAVKITKENNGQIKLSVLDFGIEGGKSITREQGHVVKLSLTPLKDIVKGGEGLVGQPE
jgi:hypothetical protein